MDDDNFNKRVDAVVEEMRALNISKILIIQDSVEIGVGDPPTATGVMEFPHKGDDELGCPPGCTSPFCDCPGTG